MPSFPRILIALSPLLSPIIAGVIHENASQFHRSNYGPGNVIDRDVVIVGGGAAGTYAAVSLADQGKTFTLIEIADRLGGHAVAYEDPASGKKVNFGVQIYDDTDVVSDFFARLNTSLAPFNPSYFGASNYYDFVEKVPVSNYTGGSLGSDYQAQLNKYPYVEAVIDTPNLVPEDLLLTWPDYLAKYPLSLSSTRASFALPATPGDPLQTLALYVFHNGNNLLLNEYSGAAVLNANRDNTELYNKAAAEFASNIIFNSSVIAAQRGVNGTQGVQLVVQTPDGNQLINAKQLILAFPTVSENTAPFDLDARESNLIDKVSGHYYYGGVVRNSGLPDNQSYVNVGKDTSYNVPSLPSVVQFYPSAAPGIHFYWYNSLSSLSQAEIESSAADTIKYLQQQLNFVNPPQPEFVDFRDFSPFHLEVSADDIRDGFYDSVNGLQGYRNTWYIGSLIAIGSSQIWANTKEILPQIVAAAA